MRNYAEKLLSENFLLTVDMLECIRRGSADILYASENAVLLIDMLSETCMIYMTSENEDLKKVILSKIPSHCKIFNCHDKYSYSMLKENFNFASEMKCQNAVYRKNKYLPDIQTDASIRPIDENYSEEVIKYYAKAKIAEEWYVRERIQSGNVFGAFIGDTLCGFVGTHIEGSIGMLEVLPQYKRKHIGSMLEAFTVNKALSAGAYPYGQVVKGNTASINLQKKLGFEISEDYLYWLII